MFITDSLPRTDCTFVQSDGSSSSSNFKINTGLRLSLLYQMPPRVAFARRARSTKKVMTHRKHHTARSVSLKPFKRVLKSRVPIRKRAFGKPLGKYLDRHANYVVGHKPHITKRFTAKVQTAMTPPNYRLIQNVTVITGVLDGCKYGCPTPLYQFADINNLAGIIYGSGSYLNSLRFQIRSVEARYDLKNVTNVPIYARIYECTPRFDIPNTSFIAGTGAVTTTVLSCITDGFTDLGGAGINDQNQTLFNNPGFVSRFKIESCRTQKLLAGEQTTYHLKSLTPRTINMQRWISLSSNGSADDPQIYLAANLSRFLVFQMWGGSIVEEATLTSVGTGISNCNIICNMKYTYSTLVQGYSTAQANNTSVDGQGGSVALATSFVTPGVFVEQSGLLAVAASA